MRTIEELEGENWGEPKEEESYLVNTYLQLRRKPVDQFSIEDMRLMIGQDIGTKHLMPYALDALESDPFAEGDFYPGDLLSYVVRLPDNYWSNQAHQLERALRIAHRAIDMISAGESPFLGGELRRKLCGELQSFIWQHERMNTTVTTNQY